jgi:alkylation response protein AidB-like acyl-CoA dehydrogenase
MNFDLSEEQQLLREAAAGTLSRIETVAGARAALDGGELPDVWPAARAAGWTGLLVPEELGGAGLGTFDAMLVLEQCGRRLTGAGLLGHLGATLVLALAAEAGDERAGSVLPGLADGSRRAALVWARPPVADEGWSVEGVEPGERRAAPPRLEPAGESIRTSGAAGFQPDVAQADLLVVPAVDGSGELRALLVEPGTPGASVDPLVRYDASRPLGQVSLEAAEAEPLVAGAAALDEAWQLGQALLAADALGVAETMLELGVAYAKDRYAFGRPIGSYQAVKHQLVDILRHAGTARSLCYYAGLAAESRPDELALAASCARFAAEQAAGYATRICIAVHGGIGATWEHDAQLYWRRAQLSRLLLGGSAGAAERVAEEIIARAREQAEATTLTGAKA